MGDVRAAVPLTGQIRSRRSTAVDQFTPRDVFHRFHDARADAPDDGNVDLARSSQHHSDRYVHAALYDRPRTAVRCATIRYKNISSIFGLVKFVFVAFIVAGPTSEEVFALKLLPLVQGSYLLQRVMNEELRLWDLEPLELSVLVLVGLAYFAFGYVLFRYFTERARTAGVMGHY